MSSKKKGVADKVINRPLSSTIDPDEATSTTLTVFNKDKGSVMAANSAKVSMDKVIKSKAPFRHRWQKSGRFSYQEDLVKNADDKEGSAGGSVRRSAKNKSESDNDDDDATCNDTPVRQHTGGKTVLSDFYEEDESDAELRPEDESDDDYEGATSGKQPIVDTPRKRQSHKKGGEPDPNGRVVGRKLVMWHRPRMVEKLILHLQYECHRAGIKLPWDKAVTRLSTGSSGEAAMQHLNKLRDVLITEGHMVPPLLGKFTVPQDPTVRGYVRDMDAEKPTETTVVRWGEMVEDRKQNLEVEGLIRGSGNYRRGLNKALEKTQKATGMRRNRLPVELREAQTVPSRYTGTKICPRAASSLGPAEMGSDEDYDPSTKKKGKYGLRKATKTSVKYTVEDTDSETDEDVEDPLRHVVTDAFNTPQANRVKGSSDVQGLMTPPSTMNVKLKLQPDLLKQFASDTGVQNKILEEETGVDGEHWDVGTAEYYEDGSDFSNDEDTKAFGKYGSPSPQHRQISVHPFAKDIFQQLGYLGMDVHGTRAQYDDAISNGLNPKTNGLKYKRAVAKASVGTEIHGGGDYEPTAPHSYPSAGAEIHERRVYKLTAPPAYSFHSASHDSISPLAGTSASVFASLTGGPVGNNAMSAQDFGDYDQTQAFMTGCGGQNLSTHYSHSQEKMGDPFHSSQYGYASSSDIFHTRSTTFHTSSLPAVSYNADYAGHGDRSGIDMRLDGQEFFDNKDAPLALNTIATSFRVAQDNVTFTAATSNGLENLDDDAHLAQNSPPHYLAYIPEENDENKENGWDYSTY